MSVLPDKIVNDFLQVAALAGESLSVEDILIEDARVPAIPRSIPVLCSLAPAPPGVRTRRPQSSSPSGRGRKLREIRRALHTALRSIRSFDLRSSFLPKWNSGVLWIVHAVAQRHSAGLLRRPSNRSRLLCRRTWTTAFH